MHRGRYPCDPLGPTIGHRNGVVGTIGDRHDRGTAARRLHRIQPKIKFHQIAHPIPVRIGIGQGVVPGQSLLSRPIGQSHGIHDRQGPVHKSEGIVGSQKRVRRNGAGRHGIRGGDQIGSGRRVGGGSPAGGKGNRANALSGNQPGGGEFRLAWAQHQIRAEHLGLVIGPDCGRFGQNFRQQSTRLRQIVITSGCSRQAVGGHHLDIWPGVGADEVGQGSAQRHRARILSLQSNQSGRAGQAGRGGAVIGLGRRIDAGNRDRLLRHRAACRGHVDRSGRQTAADHIPGVGPRHRGRSQADGDLRGRERSRRPYGDRGQVVRAVGRNLITVGSQNCDPGR